MDIHGIWRFAFITGLFGPRHDHGIVSCLRNRIAYTVITYSIAWCDSLKLSHFLRDDVSYMLLGKTLELSSRPEGVGSIDKNAPSVMALATVSVDNILEAAIACGLEDGFVVCAWLQPNAWDS